MTPEEIFDWACHFRFHGSPISRTNAVICERPLEFEEMIVVTDPAKLDALLENYK